MVHLLPLFVPAFDFPSLLPQPARHWGVFVCLLSFAQAKKVRRRQGPQPLHSLALIDGLPVAPGRRPTFLAGQEK